MERNFWKLHLHPAEKPVNQQHCQCSNHIAASCSWGRINQPYRRGRNEQRLPLGTQQKYSTVNDATRTRRYRGQDATVDKMLPRTRPYCGQDTTVNDARRRRYRQRCKEKTLLSTIQGEDATVGDARRKLVCSDVVDIADIL